MKLKYINLKKT